MLSKFSAEVYPAAMPAWPPTVSQIKPVPTEVTSCQVLGPGCQERCLTYLPRQRKGSPRAFLWAPEVPGSRGLPPVHPERTVTLMRVMPRAFLGTLPVISSQILWMNWWGMTNTSRSASCTASLRFGTATCRVEGMQRRPAETPPVHTLTPSQRTLHEALHLIPCRKRTLTCPFN